MANKSYALARAEILANIGDPSGDTLSSLTAKWGDIARTLKLILGARWDTAGDLGTDVAALLAVLGVDIEAVYLDTVNGTAGTAWPLGTTTNPVSNMTDALAIAATRKLRTIKFWGYPVMPAANVFGIRFIGMGDSVGDQSGIEIVGGYDLEACQFENTAVIWSGASTPTGVYCFKDCYYVDAATFDLNNAWFFNCVIHGSWKVKTCRFFNCTFDNTYLDSIAGAGIGYFYNCGGQISLNSLTVAETFFVYGGTITVVVDADISPCTAGTLNIYGSAILLDRNADAGMTINDYTAHMHEKQDGPISVNAIAASETDIVLLSANYAHFILRHLRLKSADPGANTVDVRLYEHINDITTLVGTFSITTANFGTYFSLMDMFGVPELKGPYLKITVQASGGGPYAVTGQYSYAQSAV